MKRKTIIALFLIATLSFTGCNNHSDLLSRIEELEKDNEDITISSSSAISTVSDASSDTVCESDNQIYTEYEFERLLNEGKDLTGTTVIFTVRDYKPNSALGCNLWAGEHLNFVSANEPSAKKGISALLLQSP